MTKHNLNFDNTVIYKICCKDENIKDLYVGHTTNFKTRQYNHINCCKNEKTKGYNIKLYKFIRANGGFDNWNIEKLEDYKCGSKEEALKKELEYSQLLNATLNNNKQGRKIKQYYEENKEKFKEYYKENKDVILGMYQLNKESYIEKVKVWQEKNKDKLVGYAQKYRDCHKEKLNCSCGGVYSALNKKLHCSTKKHIKYLDSL